MKKLIASILCACTISSLLVGCGSTSDQADQAGDTTAEHKRMQRAKKVQKVQEMQRQMQMRIM